MTSMSQESVATIICTSRQTRFPTDAGFNIREFDIHNLNITVTSPAAAGGEKKSTGRGKAKARSEGLEILTDAKLRLKEGQRYALVGRNGCGKSTLLRAIADKLIPGIFDVQRIALLQQTEALDGVKPSGEGVETLSTLQHVIERATSKEVVEREIKTLSEGVEANDPNASIRALRGLKYDRMQRHLFRLDKDARLRSGARGFDARKALKEYEKEITDAEAYLKQPPEEISPETLQVEIQEAVDMLEELKLQVEPSRLAEIEGSARKIMSGLGFTEELMAKPVTSLSGGWQMRSDLAIALLQDTDILILDEPTNFLDLLGIMWLQKYLESMEDRSEKPPTLILVSHDRDFTTLCTDLLLLKDKGLTYFHGDLATYESSQSERKLYLTRMKEAKDKQKAHIEKSIAANMKAGKANDDQNKIRQAKSRQKKLDDRWGVEVSDKGHRFKLNRDFADYGFTKRREIEIPQGERPVVLVLPEPPELRFPGPLISLEKVSYKYSSKGKFVIDDVDLNISMGDRVGILGLNGSGKSTLIKVLVEQSRPTSGTITTHPRLKLGYYSQHAVDNLRRLGEAEPSLTALALLTREVEGALEEGDLRGLLGELGLPGRIASDVPVAKLSGGQLVRCELARLFWRRPHCLILDEVTTHLDYETVTALREALSEWEGAVVLVSHDRWFMRGAVEGQVEDDEDGSAGDDDGDEIARRRSMYRLKGGKLMLLENGVDEFERIMEKRVRKMLDQ